MGEVPDRSRKLMPGRTETMLTVLGTLAVIAVIGILFGHLAVYVAVPEA